MTRPGVFVVDFGHNMAGWATLQIPSNLQRGQNVTVVYGEILSNQTDCYLCTTPYHSNISRPQRCPCRGEVAMRYPSSPMVDVYILRGDGEAEKFEPVGTCKHRQVHTNGFRDSMWIAREISSMGSWNQLDPHGIIEWTLFCCPLRPR